MTKLDELCKNIINYYEAIVLLYEMSWKFDRRTCGFFNTARGRGYFVHRYCDCIVMSLLWSALRSCEFRRLKKPQRCLKRPFQKESLLSDDAVSCSFSYRMSRVYKASVYARFHWRQRMRAQGPRSRWTRRRCIGIG